MSFRWGNGKENLLAEWCRMIVIRGFHYELFWQVINVGLEQKQGIGVSHASNSKLYTPSMMRENKWAHRFWYLENYWRNILVPQCLLWEEFSVALFLLFITAIISAHQREQSPTSPLPMLFWGLLWHPPPEWIWGWRAHSEFLLACCISWIQPSDLKLTIWKQATEEYRVLKLPCSSS